MAGSIDMVNPGVLGSHTPESTVPSGGSGEIEMLGGSNLHLSHSPVSSAQTGGKGAGIEMIGEGGLLDRGNVVKPNGAQYPSDKGE